jgi:uncharacterized protein Yka (UPF0111/DUF47 family)
MASDQELAHRIARVESGSRGVEAGATARDELDEYKAVAGEIHDELARRIEAVDDDKLDERAFEALDRRLERLESRIDALETRL